MPKSIGRKGIIAIVLALIAVIGVASLAFFTDRVDHSMQFTTASFSADGYTLTRTAPEGPFCAGEEVTATLKESNTGDDDVNSIISMKATWVSPDTALSIFGNANAADNAKLSIDGTDISYKVSTDKKSITFDLPKQVLAAGTKDAARDLTLTIPASFKSTGRIEFTFEKVVVAQEGGGFSKEYSRTDLNAAGDLDYSVKVGWAASSIAAQNGKALMGYLTDKNASGKFGIEFEFAYNYNTSPMKDFASKTDAKWSYYKDKADRLTFVEGMTTIGDYAFPDFELVTSLKLPESLVSVGKWSFDNISISALKLPAALTNFDTMSFGHINELTAITFEQAANTNLSFPTAGSSTGAFFVAPYAEPTNRTKINGTNTDALAYDWVADQRKLVPVLQSWDPEANTDFHGLRDKVSGISFTNSYALPDGFDTAAGYGPWDVSAAKDGSVMAYMTPKTGADIASGYYFIYAASLPDGITGTVVKGNGSVTWDATAGKYTWSADKVAATGKTVSEWIAGGYTGTNYFVPDNDPTTYYSIANSDGENSQLTKYVRAGGYNVVIASNTGWTEDVIANADSDYICNNMLGLTTFSDDHLDTSNVKSFRQTFNNCSSLTDCDLSGVDSSNVKNFYGMFNGCSNLTTLNATFDTSGVNDATLNKTADPLMALSSDEKENGISGGLAHLFDGCEKLTAVDTSAWELSGAQSLHSTFSDCKALTGLEVGNWNVSGVQSFECTFNNCYNIAALDVSRWQVGNAETMERMFNSCGSLTTLAVDNWDVSKVKDFGCMFVNCNQLKTLNVSKWNTSSAETMSSMFWCCESLQALDVSKWDVSKVKSFYFAFADCPLITKLAVGNWNTSSVQTFYYMFAGCEKLTTIDVATKKVNAGTANEYTAWDTSHADTFDYMFGYCYSLTNLDVSDWAVTGSGTCADGSAKRSLSTFRMFAGTKIEKITLGAGWDELDTTLYGMLYLTDITFEHTASDALALTSTPGSRDGIGYVGTSSIITSSPYNADNLLKTNIHVSNKTIKDIVFAYDWTSDFRKAVPDVPTLAAGSGWYKGTTAKSTITEIELVDTYTATGNEAESWDASAAQDGSVMAYVNGTKLIIAGNGYGKVLANADSTSAFNAFTNVTSFTGLNKLDTSNVTNMQTMFNNLDNIQTLDLSSFNTSKVTNFYSIFGGNDKLTTLNLTGWDTSAAKNMGQMFYVCNALTTINGLSSFNTANVTDMSGMFHGCKAMTSLDLSNFNTAKVKTLSMMFYQCSNLETVKLTSFDTSNVTSLYAMFQYCYKLKTADLSSFNTAKVTNMRSMFGSCEAVENLDLSSFDTSAVTNMYAAFDGCHKLQEITLGTKFKFVGTDGYLPTPSSTYIPQADGNWYVKGLTKHYTPAELAAVTRVRAVTYSAIPGTDPGTGGGSGGGGGTLEGEVRWPVQSGALTYNGNAQSPSWSGYDSSKMTIGGTTSGTNAGTYTATFTLKDGYCWPDGTADAVSVTWKIGKAAGSLSLSPTTMTIDASSTTGTITVTRAGDGAITAKSSNTNIATVSVDGNKITVTKKGDGTATITVSVAESANYLAPSDKTSNVKCESVPTLAANSSWYKGTTAKSAITAIKIKDSYTPTGTVTEQWNADVDNSGSIKAYVEGTKLIIAGNGAGKIMANADSSSAFIDFTKVTTIFGLDKLDTSKVTSMASMFSMDRRGGNLTYLDVSGWDTSNVTSMAGMFMNCAKLEVLDVSKWDTSNVTRMGSMFYGCNALTSLDLSGFDTSNVTNMGGMFSVCRSLTSLDVSNFDTSKVTYMGGMFDGCQALTSLDVSGFDTSNVTDMYGMFRACNALTSLDLSGFDTSKVTDMEAMFAYYRMLQTVTLGKDFKFVGTNGYLPAPSSEYITGADGNWYDTKDGAGYTPAELASVTRTETRTYVAVKPAPTLAEGYSWYKGSTAKSTITAIEIKDSYTPSGTPTESWNADVDNSGSIKAYVEGTKLTIAGNGAGKIMANADSTSAFSCDIYAYEPDPFASVTAISGLDKLDTSNVTDMATMFLGCSSLTSLDLSGFNTSKVTNMGNMFGGCSSLTRLDLSGFDTSKVTNMGSMFGSCEALTSLDVSGWNTSNVTTMQQMFYYCKAMVSLDLSGWNTSNVTTMQSMFWCCSKLTSVDVSGFNTSNVTDMEYMFNYCEALTSLDLSGWNTSNVTTMRQMFRNCKALTSVGDLSGFNTSNVTNMYFMFEDCNALTSVGDLSGWNTSKVTNMGGMFFRCYKLTSLDLSGWDTSNVTDMGTMFYNCTALTGVGNLSGWDTSNVTDMQQMFDGCNALTSLDVSGWNTSNVTTMQQMFKNCKAMVSLDISGWDTSNVTIMYMMFSDCTALTKIYASDLWSTAGVTNARDMFLGCSKLSGAISYNSSKVDATYANYTTGYLTYKAAPARSMSIMSNGSEISGYSISE